MATYEMKDPTGLTDDELGSLEEAIVAAFTAADEADDLDAMSAAADDLDAVRAEKTGRESAPATEEVIASGDPDPDELEAEAEALEAEAEAVEDEKDDEEAVTASANNEAKEAAVELPEDRQPVKTASTVTITAGADIPGMQHGNKLTSAMEVAEAFVSRLGTFRGVRGGDGEQLIVATVASAAPAERTLDPGDIDGNRAKIEAVTSLHGPQGIVASGGFCAPLEVNYDIFGLGVADRPVRDALAGFQATRGGIRYTQPPVLADFAAAVGIWTAANDANPTAPTTKPCLKIACSPEQTATVDAVTVCLEIGNLMARAYPELVSRNNDLAMIQHARIADLQLLSKISALSTKVTSGFKLGVARDFLEAVGRAATAYRARHRMGNDVPLRAIVPSWVRDAIREDLTWSLPGDQLEWADSVIDGFLRARKVNVKWHLDDASVLTGAQAAGALNAWPASFKWHIFAEGTFLFLDGGTLDLGIVRDGALVSTNDYKMFVETFEGLAKIGIEGIEVTTTTKIAGATAATVATTA